MKAVRVEMLLSDPTFKNKMTLSRIVSYLLPPPSTVIGMVHTACGFKEYHSMDVSIQSIDPYVIVNTDFEHRWFGGAKVNLSTEEGRKDAKRRWKVIVNEGYNEPEKEKLIGWTMSPKEVDHIIDLHLILHIIPKNQNEIDTIFNGILYPSVYLSLGQWHDLADIKHVAIVEISEKKHFTKYNGLAYKLYKNKTEPELEVKKIDEELYKIPVFEDNEEKLKEFKINSSKIIESGDTNFLNLNFFHKTVINLGKDYVIKYKKRIFNQVDVVLFDGYRIDEENYGYEYLDSDGIPVFMI